MLQLIKKKDFIWMVILMAVLKALRDVELFRWEVSIFGLLPVQLQDALCYGWSVIDWFHITDALIIAIPLVFIFKQFSGSYKKAILYYIPFFVIFYQIFNLFYHVVFTLPAHWDLPLYSLILILVAVSFIIIYIVKEKK